MSLRRNALLLGGTGFAGTHIREMLEAEYQVTATGRDHDIASKETMNGLVRNARPDIVVNLASITTVRESYEDPEKTYRIGFLGTLNLLFALKEHGFKGRMLNVSSSEVYGFPKENQLPLKEGAPLCPMSPYAVSKVAVEALCYQWSEMEAFGIVTARAFTHIGPGQSERFATSSFAKQVAEIMLGMRKPVIRVGNLDYTRDLSDVRDIARGYVMLLEQGETGNVYNICSGRETRMRCVVDNLIELSNIDTKVEQDASLTRASEQQRICGSFEKLNSETGWKPEIPLSQTLSDTLEHWLERLKTDKSAMGHRRR